MYRFRSRRTSHRATTATLLALAMALWTPGEALAQCHVATFEENERTVQEAHPGYVELVVELEGDPLAPVTCTGELSWETHNRTARAPGDYKDSEGVLRWSPGSPRRQSFRVPVHNDSLGEGNETFSVEIRATPGSGIQPEEPGPHQGGPFATITIADDERPSASTSPSGPPSTASASPAAEPTASASGSAPPRGVQSTPTVASFGSQSPSATPAATGLAAAKRAGDRGPGIGLPVLAIVGLSAVAGAWLMRRRGARG